MTILIADCPRCGAARTTFDVKQENLLYYKHDWQRWSEVFCVCRHCHTSTVFIVKQKTNDLRKEVHLFNFETTSLNNFFDVERFISIRDRANNLPPEHLPEVIGSIYNEAATCLATECWNAAGAMFRQCLDLATKSLIPEDAKITPAQKGKLALRLEWLFENGLLPKDLKTLSTCIREDGNDGAHDGSLQNEDALDLEDFTHALLCRIYTEPEKLRIAEERRNLRRQQAQ